MDKDFARKLAAEVAKHDQEYVATSHDDDSDTLTIPVTQIGGEVREEMLPKQISER